MILLGRREKEKWKYVNIEGIKKNFYEISSWGNIRNIKGKYLKTYLDKDGYVKCTLSTINGKHRHFLVHRLVAIHFIENPDNKPEVNHLNPHDKTNLYYKNFEWVTQKENNNHSINHRLQIFKSCGSHGMSTLTNNDVHRICQMLENGLSNAEIINEFGISDKLERERMRGVIKHIRSRNTWKPISRLYDF